MSRTPSFDRDAFVERLRTFAKRRYHDVHPFHIKMHSGGLSKAQIQGWVLNRYYYQTRIPIKDAIILSKSEDGAFRRKWLHRITDHDGLCEGEGGLFLWVKLAEGVGIGRDEVTSLRRVIPAVRFACDSYVGFVRERSLLEAVASSLTEFFAPDIMSVRLAAWEKHYPWVDPAVQDYFRGRVTRAARDSAEAIDFVSEHATSPELADKCFDAFATKCEILWALLDAVAAGYPS